MSDNCDRTLLRQRIGFLSARYGYQFFNVDDMLTHLRAENPPGVTEIDPFKIINYIKDKINSNKTMNRYLFNKFFSGLIPYLEILSSTMYFKPTREVHITTRILGMKFSY